MTEYRMDRSFSEAASYALVYLVFSILSFLREKDTEISVM